MLQFLFLLINELTLLLGYFEPCEVRGISGGNKLLWQRVRYFLGWKVVDKVIRKKWFEEIDELN